MPEIEIADLKLHDTVEHYAQPWTVEGIRHGHGGHLVVTLLNEARGQILEIEKPFNTRITVTERAK